MRVFRGKLISKNRTIQETPVALQNCIRKRHISFSSSVRSCCNISHSIYLTSTDQSIGEIKENFYLEHACALVTSVSLTVIESYRLTITMGKRDRLDFYGVGDTTISRLQVIALINYQRHRSIPVNRSTA